MDSLLIWDNGGVTADRYTVAIAARPGWEVYTMSADPRQPNGVNMHSHTTMMQPSYKGEIQFEDTPDEVQRAILDRIDE